MQFTLLLTSWMVSRLLSVSAVPTKQNQDELTVYTSNGPITGHYASNATSVIEYLGIPYARPPVGDFRFAPPERYSNFSHYNASDWGFDCPLTASPPVDYPGLTPQASRITAYFASGANTSQSEDCLTLNIWAKPARPTSLKPVIVYLYGGRFANGNTNSPFYNAQYFTNSTGVIFVTLNYRVNIFGFPGAPGLAEQNPGLRDQRVAVEWVRDNIIAFGGDSSRIALMGQSAGAVAVDWWSYAHKDDPIVNSLISHAGNAFSFPLNPLNVTTRNWYNVSAALGCGSTGDTVSCMRTKNWTDIRTASAKIRPGKGPSPLRSIPPFYPVVDNVTVFPDYLARSQDGRFAKVPYLLGNNDYEQGYYKISAYGAGNNVTEAQSDEFLLASFTCPNALEAHSRLAATVPVWRYRYSGDWDNLRLYDNSTFNPGGSQSYHGSDLQMIFGSSEDVTGLPTSQAERQVTAWMQKAWASFVTNPAGGLEEVMGWPSYEEGKQTLAVLAQDYSSEVKYVRPEVYDAACEGIVLAGLPD